MVGLSRLARLEMARDHARREDHADTDAVVGELEPERLGETPQRELARLVRAPPAPRGQHRRGRREAQAGLVGQPLHGPEELDADIGHDQIGPAEPLGDRGGRPRDGVRLRHVHRHAERGDAVLGGQRGRLRRGTIAVDVEQDHGHPVLGGARAERAAEARCATGDDSDVRRTARDRYAAPASPAERTSCDTMRHPVTRASALLVPDPRRR